MLGFGSPVFAQSDAPSSLTINTAYPSMVVGIGETVTLNMSVKLSGVTGREFEYCRFAKKTGPLIPWRWSR